MSLYLQTRDRYGAPWSKPVRLQETGLQLMSYLRELNRKDPTKHLLITTATGEVDHGFFPNTSYQMDMPRTIEAGGTLYERV